MGLAFWRRNQAVAQTARAGAAAERENEGVEQEAEVRRRTRHRLIGAAILLVAAVIIVPMLLEADPRTVPDDVQITMPTQPPAAPAAGTAPTPAVEKPVAIAADTPKSELQRAESAAGEAKRSEPTAETKGETTKAAEAQTAPVKPEPPAAAPAPPEPKAVNGKEDPIAALLDAQQPTVGRFALQAAALSSEKSARELAARLKKAGFKSYIEPVKTGAGTAHRVRVGPFDSRASVEKAREALRAAGFNAVVVDA